MLADSSWALELFTFLTPYILNTVDPEKSFVARPLQVQQKLSIKCNTCFNEVQPSEKSWNNQNGLFFLLDLGEL